MIFVGIILTEELTAENCCRIWGKKYIQWLYFSYYG